MGILLSSPLRAEDSLASGSGFDGLQKLEALVECVFLGIRRNAACRQECMDEMSTAGAEQRVKWKHMTSGSAVVFQGSLLNYLGSAASAVPTQRRIGYFGIYETAVI